MPNCRCLKPVVTALSLSLLTTSALPALAQFSSITSSSSSALATDQAQFKIELPAGSLAASLNALARQTGITLSVDPALVSGLQVAGLSGEYPVQQALGMLLANTGLTATRSADGGYSIVMLEAGVEMLPPVKVSADAVFLGATEGTGFYTTDLRSAATGLNLSLRETPQSVSVITHQRIEDQGLIKLGKVLEQTPGISHSQQGGYLDSTQAYSRGYRIANYDIDGLPGTGQVSTGHSGFYDVSSIDTALYDSVTIIRGTAGLIHGSGDPSAVVSLSRKRPTTEFQASTEMTLGTWNKRRFVGDVAGPLTKAGSVRGRLVAVYDDSESWLDRYQGRRTVIYGVAEADLSDSTILSVFLQHQNVESESDAAGGPWPLVFTDGSPTPFNRNDNRATNWSGYERDTTNLSLRLGHYFNNNWQAQIEYSLVDTDNRDLYGTPININPDGSAGMFIRHIPRVYEWDGLNVKITGQYGLFGRQHDLVIGYNDESNTVDTDFSQDFSQTTTWTNWNGDFPYPDLNALFVTPTRFTLEQSGFYLTNRFNISGALKLLVGARLSTWETALYHRQTQAVFDDRTERDVITTFIGATYAMTQNLSIYASFAEVFNPQNNADVNGNILDPQEGSNTEVGIKGEWFGSRLNASLALFQSGKDNLAIADGTNITPAGGAAFVAKDDTEGKGWEVEVAGEILPGWQMQGGYTQMKLEDSSGERLNTQYHPEKMFKLFTSWTPSNIPGLTVGGGLRWQSELFNQGDSPALRAIRTQDSFAVIDVMARYAINESILLTLNVNNLSDKTYLSNLSTGYITYGAPREVNVTLKYQF